jgi:hypothetical protein
MNLRKLKAYLLGRAKEPTTWASIVALVAIFEPQAAHILGLIAGALGVGLPEQGNVAE